MLVATAQGEQGLLQLSPIIDINTKFDIFLKAWERLTLEHKFSNLSAE